MVNLKDILKEAMKRGIIIPASDVPRGIRQWVKDTIGVNLTKYTLYQDSEVGIHCPWHEGDRNYWQAFQLTPDGDAKENGVLITKSGMDGGGVGERSFTKTFEVKDGFCMVMAGIYPKRCEIYAGPGSTKMLGPGPADTENLSNDELAALEAAAGLIASYRPKFKQSVYDSLIAKGLMKRNKSITIQGKNVRNAIPDTKRWELKKDYHL